MNSDNRRDVLEFLRNLTPQVFLIVLFILSKENIKNLSFCDHSLKYIGLLLVSFGIFGIWFYAFTANFSLLFEKICSSFVELSETQEKLKNENIKGFKLYLELFKAAKKMKASLTFQFFAFFILTILGCIAVVFQAAYVLTKLD